MKETLAVRISSDLAKRVKVAAILNETTASALVEEALLPLVERLEQAQERGEEVRLTVPVARRA